MINLSFSCPENLNAMPKTDCGRYCTSCQREIFDFTGKSSTEINKILRENPQIKCGIFDPTQVKKDPVSKVNRIFRLAFAAVFFFGISSNAVFGQEDQKSDTTIVQKVFESNTIIITGTVTGPDSLPQPFTKVWIVHKNIVIGVVTDMEGKYKLELQDDLNWQNIELHFKFIGYVEQEVIINNIEVQGYVVNMRFTEEAKYKMLAGIIMPEPNRDLLNKDPYKKTVIKGDDLNRW